MFKGLSESQIHNEEIGARMKVGTKVRRKNSGEVGVILHTWQCTEPGFEEDIDCYVAFYGDSFPDKGKSCKKPYVLRYFCSSLEVVNEPRVAR